VPYQHQKATFPFFKKNENTVKTRVAEQIFIAVLYKTNLSLIPLNKKRQPH